MLEDLATKNSWYSRTDGLLLTMVPAGAKVTKRNSDEQKRSKAPLVPTDFGTVIRQLFTFMSG